MIEKKQLLLFIFIITLFSLIVTPGYEVFTSDHALYIPQILHAQNPSIFENDLLVTFNLHKYSLFGELIYVFQNTLKTNIFTTFFILMFLTRFIHYYSIYNLALYFSSNKTFSLLTTLVFIPGFSVYGYPYSTVDTILLSRSIGFSLNLLFLVLFLKNKKFLSLLFLILAMLIHPMSSLFFIAFLILETLIASKRKKYLYLFTLIFVFFFFTAYLTVSGKLSTSSLLTMLKPIDSFWLTIIKERNPYYFISSWNYQLLLLFSNIILFIVVLLEGKSLFKEKIKRRYIHLLFYLPFCLLITYFILVEIFKLPFFIQLQLLRNLGFLKIFSIFFFFYFTYETIKKYPKEIIYNFFLIGILSSFVFEKSFIFPLPNKGSLTLVFLPGFIYFWLRKKYQLSNLKKKNYLSHKELLIVLLLILFSLVISRLLIIRLAVLIPLILSVGIVTISIKLKQEVFTKYYYLTQPISLLILILVTLFSVPKFKITPDYLDNKPFMEACDWTKNNTEKKATFITEPFSNMSRPLRLSCLKKVFVCRKDGSIALYDKNYAFEWKKRMDLVNKLKDNYKTLSEISDQYNVDYIFSDSKLDINKPEVFGNGKYFIYKIK